MSSLARFEVLLIAGAFLALVATARPSSAAESESTHLGDPVRQERATKDSTQTQATSRGAAPRAPSTEYDSGDPTSDEQLVLELINRARSDPPAEATRLGLSSVLENAPGSNLASSFANPKAPMAMNKLLLGTARAHSQDMYDRDYFAHNTLGSGLTPFDRMDNAGYNWNSAGENIAVGSNHTAAELEDLLFIDAGISGRGHRTNILGNFREIGIGYDHNTTVNGLGFRDYLTQDFGTISANGPFLVGVVYDDTNTNSFYDKGEGLSGITIMPDTGTFYAVTKTAGGFVIPVKGISGSFNLTATGSAFGPTGKIEKTVTLDGTNNLKVDFLMSEVISGPTANADTFNMSEDSTLTVTSSNDVLTNDDDPAGGGLTAIKVTDPSHAQSFTFNSDGTFTYTPVTDYFGTDSFTYKVEDINTDQSTAATVTINISNVNDNPTLTTNAGLTVNEGAQGTVGSSKLLVSDVDNTTAQITFTLTSSPTNGSLRNNTTTINASGTFTQANVSGNVINYLHNGGETTTDSFQVTVSDGSGGGGNLGTITFNVTITPQNDAPTLSANTGLTVNEGAQGTIGNTKLQATDPDSGTLTFTLQTAPANGALRNNTTTISQGQTFTQANINANVINYLHNGGETTSDSFVFSVSDGSGGNIGNTTFNITVTAVNDNPTLTTNAGLAANEGAQGTIDNTKLLVSDVDSATITFTLTSAPANGSLRNNTTTINASGTFTQANINGNVINYLHNGGETTTDSFQVTVSDGNGGGGNLGTITFNITITPVNDPPAASITTPNASEVDVDESDTVDFVATSTDPDGGAPTYTWDFGDGTGDTGTNVNHQFAPGSYLVTVTVSDGSGGVDVASVTVNVAGGAADGALLVLKGAFTVAWSSHAKSQLKDKFTLAGTLNPSGLPAAIPGGAEVEVWANAVGETPVLLTGAAIPLDAKGSGSGAAGDGTDKFKVKVSPKNGKYSVSLSNTDLRSVLGLTEDAAANQTLPVEANLIFNGIGTMAFPDLLGNCEFLYSTKQSSSSKGKFALKSNDLLSGAFVALKTSASQDKASSDYMVTLTAAMVSGGGGPVEPTGPVTVTIGGANPIAIPFNQLVQSGSGTTSTYTLVKGGAPGLSKFSISNSKKSLSLATDLLSSTDIPVVNDPELEHELTITVEVEVNGGDTHTFETTVELMRSKTSTGKWKR